MNASMLPIARDNYFYPFYGSENLTCDPAKLEEVKAALQRLGEATK